MKWIAKANLKEKEVENELYEICCSVYDDYYNYNEELSRRYGNLLCEIQNTDIEDEVLLTLFAFGEIAKIEKFANDYKYESVAIREAATKLKSILNTMTKTILFNVENPREFNIAQKRILVFKQKMFNKLIFFVESVNEVYEEDILDYKDKIFKCCADRLRQGINETVLEMIKQNTVENKKHLKEYDIKNIYTSRELESLALSNGYKYVRSKGDHMIYEHEKTNKIVVIPDKKLGKGISVKIQKQIYNNKM